VLVLSNAFQHVLDVKLAVSCNYVIQRIREGFCDALFSMVLVFTLFNKQRSLAWSLAILCLASSCGVTCN